MKNNYLTILFSLCVWLLLGNSVLVAQTTVPDTPSQVRKLSEDFADKYDSNEYVYDREPSFFSKIKNWIINWIKSMFSVPSNKAKEIWQSIKLIFYIIVVLAVLLYIIKIVVDKDIRWIFNKNKNIKSDLDFTDEESIVQADLLQLIKDAVTNNDYRTAVRYYYLHTLKKLDNSAIIKYDVQKTTIDYQLELKGSKYGNLFSKAAYYYTYIWYGEFQITEQEYQTTSRHYNELLNSINNG